MDFTEQFTRGLSIVGNGTGLDQFHSHASQYMYEPLPLKDGKAGPFPFTRLLHLQPGSYADEISCDLAVANIRQLRNGYEALSYVWGSPDPPSYVTCGGKTVKVTQNLHQALLHLRHATRVRLLWVDAICINQRDLDERNQQVQLMRYIYEHASRTYVWFGADRLLELDLLVIKNCFKKMRSKAAQAEPISKQQEIYLELYTGLSKSVTRLARNTWYDRMWVVQEATVSKRLTAICGSVMYDFLKVLQLIGSLDPEENNIRARSNLQFWAQLHKLRDVPKRVQFSLGSLLSALQELRDFKATDPRDKLYAILGITNEGLSPSLSLMEEAHAYKNLPQEADPMINMLQILNDQMATLPDIPLIRQARNHVPLNLENPTAEQIATGFQQLGTAASQQGLPGIANVLRERARQTEIGQKLPEADLDLLTSSFLTTSIANQTRSRRIHGLTAQELEQVVAEDVPGQGAARVNELEQMLTMIQQRNPAQFDQAFRNRERSNIDRSLSQFTAQMDQTLSQLEGTAGNSTQMQYALGTLKGLQGVLTKFIARGKAGSTEDDPFGLGFMKDLMGILDQGPQTTPDMAAFINAQNNVDDDFDRLAAPGHFHSALVPDYTKSVQQVYRDLTLYFLRRKPGLLDVLSHVQHHVVPAEGRIEGWPSWVPRWDQRSIGPLVTSLGEFEAGIKGEVYAQVEASDTDSGSITLLGETIAKVLRVSSPVAVTLHKDEQAEMGMIIIEFKLKLNSKHPFSAESIKLLLTKLYCAHRKKLSGSSEHNISTMDQSSPPSNEALIEIACTTTTTSNVYTINATSDTIWLFIAQVLCNRRIFGAVGRSEDVNMLGVGPMVMRPGNEVVTLYGGKVPYVLREVSAGYLLLGEAFLDEDSVMCGNAMAKGKVGKESNFLLI